MSKRLLWQQIPSPIISEIFCSSGVDGVVLDTEHACFNKETLFSCIQIITCWKRECFVRLGNLDDSMVRFCLDAGATGLIFSTVESVTQTEKIMNLCKYPQYSGKRGLGLVRQNRWGLDQLVSPPPTIIAQIETLKGVDNIQKLKGFDFYMIGPYDLSASMGIPGNFQDQKFLDALTRVGNSIPVGKMAVHIPCDVHNEIKKYKNYGIIAVGMDPIALVESCKEMKNA